MKQGLIDAFLIKNANKLSVEQKIELKNQLQSCDDKAFALLTSHKKPTTRSNFWRRAFCIILIGTTIASCLFIIECCYHWNDSWKDKWLLLAIFIFLVVFIATFFIVRMWYKRGKLKYMPKRKRLYEDYLKIIQSYQEATQSIE